MCHAMNLLEVAHAICAVFFEIKIDKCTLVNASFYYVVVKYNNYLRVAMFAFVCNFVVFTDISCENKEKFGVVVLWNIKPSIITTNTLLRSNRSVLGKVGGAICWQTISCTRHNMDTVLVNPHTTDIFYRLSVRCGVQLDTRHRITICISRHETINEKECLYLLVLIYHERESGGCHSSSLLYCMSKERNGCLSKISKIFNTPKPP